MANELIRATVYGTTQKGRTLWNELQVFEREHLTKTVLGENPIFNIPGRNVPKKPTETWAASYFIIPTEGN
jgi:hypothetical protein